MTTVYFDTCALNRLTDDQSQPRIREEAEASEHILQMVTGGHIRWSSSTVLRTELLRNTNINTQRVSVRLLDYASESLIPSPLSKRRATELELAGYGVFDALHLALAEQASVDALLTVDDRFLKRAARGEGNPAIPVMNPVDWLRRRRSWLLKR